MEVIIQISTPAESAERRQEQLIGLHSTVAAFGLALEPMHPDTHDQVLSTYFHVWAPDEQTAARVVEAVQKLPVAAAYVKPQSAPP